MFRARRCLFAEDLADITIERVAHKLTTLTSKFIGDPAPYFFGVAKKIYFEYLRGLKANQLRATCCLPTRTDTSDSEKKLELLEKALGMIPNADRELILKYYAWNGKNKIDQRRALADQMGIRLNALRLRVFRIRKEIKKQILKLDPELARKHPFNNRGD
jgi:DNA-directed RNA polymerase specialized sigma24 family protein